MQISVYLFVACVGDPLPAEVLPGETHSSVQAMPVPIVCGSSCLGFCFWGQPYFFLLIFGSPLALATNELQTPVITPGKLRGSRAEFE